MMEARGGSRSTVSSRRRCVSPPHLLRPVALETHVNDVIMLLRGGVYPPREGVTLSPGGTAGERGIKGGNAPRVPGEVA